MNFHSSSHLLKRMTQFLILASAWCSFTAPHTWLKMMTQLLILASAWFTFTAPHTWYQWCTDCSTHFFVHDVLSQLITLDWKWWHSYSQLLHKTCTDPHTCMNIAHDVPVELFTLSVLQHAGIHLCTSLHGQDILYWSVETLMLTFAWAWCGVLVPYTVHLMHDVHI